MFSGDIEGFDKEIEKQEHKESYIKQFLLKKYRDNNNRWLAYTIYTGAITCASEIIAVP